MQEVFRKFALFYVMLLVAGSAKAEPALEFAVSVDFPLNQSLVITAASLEKVPYDCELIAKATVIQESDPQSRSSVLLSRIMMRVNPSGFVSEPLQRGKEELANLGVPGARYSGGEIARTNCVPTEPIWIQIGFSAGVEAGYQFSFRTKAEETYNFDESFDNSSIEVSEANPSYAAKLKGRERDVNAVCAELGYALGTLTSSDVFHDLFTSYWSIQGDCYPKLPIGIN